MCYTIHHVNLSSLFSFLVKWNSFITLNVQKKGCLVKFKLVKSKVGQQQQQQSDTRMVFNVGYCKIRLGHTSGCRSVRHFGPDLIITATTVWICMKCSRHLCYPDGES